MSRSRPHEAVLEFDYDSATRARVVARAVRREAGDIGTDRSRTTVERDGSLLSVAVVASDLVALRAGVNTWQSLVSVAERSCELAADC